MKDKKEKFEAQKLLIEGNHFNWEYYEKWLKKKSIKEPECLRERR